MKNCKFKKISYSTLATFIILVALCMVNPSVLYARTTSLSAQSVDIGSGKYITLGQFTGKNWSIVSYDSKIVSVVKTTVGGTVPAIYCTGKDIGSTTIKLANNSTGMDYTMLFKVNALPATLKINRGNGLTNQTQPLIVDFQATWKIETKYGWSVYSPDAGIIKVTDINHKNGTITFKATNSSKRLNSNTQPGLTYILIIEKYTGAWKKHWIQVKPYANSIKISNYRSAYAGDVQYLNATTYPQNYVGMSGHGKITWSSSNTKIATVDQSGKVFFKASGSVQITVMYSDGKHNRPYAGVNYTVKKPATDLYINRNPDGNIVKDTSEVIIDGFSRTWTITSKYGWRVYSPDVGIIKVTNTKGNKLTYKALRSDKRINSNYEKGYTYITIIENYTDVKKTFWVKVYPHVTSIEIEDKNQKFKVGSTYKLNAQTRPYNYIGRAGFGRVTWSTSNPNVATVDNKGNVKVKAYGQATITVTYKAGNVEVSDSVFIINTDIKIINIGEQIYSYMIENGYEFMTGPLGNTFEESKKYKSTCCATYVSWVLQECGYIDNREHFDNCGIEEELLLAHGWKKIEGKESNLKPGDIIICWTGDVRRHTEIYVGNGKSLDGGTVTEKDRIYKDFKITSYYTKYDIYRLNS